MVCTSGLSESVVGRSHSDVIETFEDARVAASLRRCDITFWGPISTIALNFPSSSMERAASAKRTGCRACLT